MSKGADWFNDIESHDSYWIEKAKIDFAVSVNEKLKSRKINRSSFAELLKTSTAYVTKLLRGDANLSIASMVKIARALNCELHFHLAPRTRKIQWIEIVGVQPATTGVGTLKCENDTVVSLWKNKNAA